MEKVYQRPTSLQSVVSGYCPGCLHGVATKMIAESLDELGIRGKTVCVIGIGCCGLNNKYLNFDMVGSAHGRAPAVATGIKRSTPDKFVISYQGDGDLAAIGMAEIMHAANRGENITIVFINNSTFGMTGGQMAPTTLVGQKATTCQTGRDPKTTGYPMHMAEIIASLKAPVYVARFAMNNPQNIMKAKNGILKGFKLQLDGKGFTFIELLSNCPTNWGLAPEATLEYMKNNTMVEFPLGEFKVPEGSEA